MERIRVYWGEMLERGATTWWETFDPATPRSTVPSPYQGNTPTYLADDIPVSSCHGWGAAPTYLLTQRVLGVDTSGYGDGRVELNPHVPESLRWAEGTIPTPGGIIHARWERAENGTVAFRAELPVLMEWSTSLLAETTVRTEGDRKLVAGIVPVDKRYRTDVIVNALVVDAAGTNKV